MDDLKLYAGDEKSSDKLIKIVHSFSREFGVEKCAKCVIKAGKKCSKGNDKIKLKMEIL